MKNSKYRLQLLGLPQVGSLADLADYTHLSKKILYKLSKNNSFYYVKMDIPKKSGGARRIYSPSFEMKSVQAWILRNIVDRLYVSQYATAFQLKRNIIYNLERHRNNRFFFCLDIENFFPSISYARIYTIFSALGYSKFIAHIFTSLCTCDGLLPQGAVTSPALSNIVCGRMDSRISGYVGLRNIAYSRYADDMTFSSMDPQQLVGISKFIRQIIQEEGFIINENKTRVMGPKVRRHVTGFIVGDGQIGIGRYRKRLLRSAIYSFKRKDMSNEERNHLESYVNGWLSFLMDTDKAAYEQLSKYINNFS